MVHAEKKGNAIKFKFFGTPHLPSFGVVRSLLVSGIQCNLLIFEIQYYSRIFFLISFSKKSVKNHKIANLLYNPSELDKIRKRIYCALSSPYIRCLT